MNQTMGNIVGAVAMAIQTRGDGKPFHRTIPSHGYEVERDVQANGYRHSEEGAVEVYYHGSNVATVLPGDAGVWIDACRWHTVTTKNVINAALGGAGYSAHVFQRDYTWFVGDYREHEGVTFRFEDGMIVRPAGSTPRMVYPAKRGRCCYDFGIVGVNHGEARDDLGGMCETCRAA